MNIITLMMRRKPTTHTPARGTRPEPPLSTHECCQSIQKRSCEDPDCVGDYGVTRNPENKPGRIRRRLNCTMTKVREKTIAVSAIMPDAIAE